MEFKTNPKFSSLDFGSISEPIFIGEEDRKVAIRLYCPNDHPDLVYITFAKFMEDEKRIFYSKDGKQKVSITEKELENLFDHKKEIRAMIEKIKKFHKNLQSKKDESE